MSRQTHEEFLENHAKIVELEHQAHEFIVGLCKSKNIKLELKQPGRTGHCEIAEIWAFEKPIPLTQTERSQIKKFPNLYFELKRGADNTMFITEFTRSGGWCVYEIDAKDDSKYFNG